MEEGHDKDNSPRASARGRSFQRETNTSDPDDMQHRAAQKSEPQRLPRRSGPRSISRLAAYQPAGTAKQEEDTLAQRHRAQSSLAIAPQGAMMPKAKGIMAIPRHRFYSGSMARHLCVDGIRSGQAPEPQQECGAFFSRNCKIPASGTWTIYAADRISTHTSRDPLCI